MPTPRSRSRQPDYDVLDISLAREGRRRILWADERMPVLRRIREGFAKKQPLRGLRLAACLHITTETANLLRTLKAGGAEVICCASNPLSTQDDVAASLVEDFGIGSFAIRGEDRDTYYRHLRAVLERHPVITMDDGADLVNLLHTEFSAQAREVIASMEETTTGVIRLRAMEREPESVEALRAELLEAAGGNRHLDVAVADLEAELADMIDLELRARRIVEHLALCLQASLLVRHAPTAVADAFCATRLGGEGGRAFGTLPRGADCVAIVERHRPRLDGGQT